MQSGKRTYGLLILLGMVLGSGWVPSARAATIDIGTQSKSPTVSAWFSEMSYQDRTGALFASDDSRPPSVNLGQKSPSPGAISPLKKRSPVKAFVLSAIIPGAGQIYNGSKWKAAAFLGAEALFWAGHISYHSRGDDKTSEFETFAYAHWSENRYEDFLARNFSHSDGTPVRDDDSALGPDGKLYFGHHLPEVNTDQQYLEMIGKYNQFVFGWDDVDTLETPYTPITNYTSAYSANRLKYEDMRHDANSMYDRATTALFIVMANHLISGFEAAFSAKKHNKAIIAEVDRVTIRAVAARSEYGSFPMLTVNCRF